MKKHNGDSKISDEAKGAGVKMRGMENYLPPLPVEEYLYQPPEHGLNFLDIIGAVGICLGFVMAGFSIGLWAILNQRPF